MRIYLNRPRSNVKATAEYDLLDGTVTVLTGSLVSEHIAYSEKFRGAKSIEKHRAGVITNNTVTTDVVFKSPSTAANFVTGASTNGLTAWKDENGKTLKELLADGRAKV